MVRGCYNLPRLVGAADGDARRDRQLRPDADLLTFWCSAQDPHRQLAGLAAVLERRAESIRVIVPDVGGAFGSKGCWRRRAAWWR